MRVRVRVRVRVRARARVRVRVRARVRVNEALKTDSLTHPLSVPSVVCVKRP